ncbi:hypothetical protein AAMO2058_001497600 [Amorphochlora amoebiformis]
MNHKHGLSIVVACYFVTGGVRAEGRGEGPLDIHEQRIRLFDYLEREDSTLTDNNAQEFQEALSAKLFHNHNPHGHDPHSHTPYPSPSPTKFPITPDPTAFPSPIPTELPTKVLSFAPTASQSTECPSASPSVSPTPRPSSHPFTPSPVTVSPSLVGTESVTFVATFSDIQLGEIDIQTFSNSYRNALANYAGIFTPNVDITSVNSGSVIVGSRINFNVQSSGGTGGGSLGSTPMENALAMSQALESESEVSRIFSPTTDFNTDQYGVPNVTNVHVDTFTPTGAPVTVSPATFSPGTVSPVTVSPVTVSPTTVTIEPVTASPITFSPVTVSPVTVSPVTVSPVTVSPVTVSPVTVSPVTVSPVTVSPVTVSPVTVSPVTVSPVTVSPVTVSPVTVSPVTVSPVTVSPATALPVTVSPLMASPASVSPASVSPASVSPASVSPASFSPITFSPSPTSSGSAAPLPTDGTFDVKGLLLFSNRNCTNIDHLLQNTQRFLAVEFQDVFTPSSSSELRVLRPSPCPDPTAVLSFSFDRVSSLQAKNISSAFGAIGMHTPVFSGQDSWSGGNVTLLQLLEEITVSKENRGKGEDSSKSTPNVVIGITVGLFAWLMVLAIIVCGVYKFYQRNKKKQMQRLASHSRHSAPKCSQLEMIRDNSGTHGLQLPENIEFSNGLSAGTGNMSQLTGPSGVFGEPHVNQPRMNSTIPFEPSRNPNASHRHSRSIQYPKGVMELRAAMARIGARESLDTPWRQNRYASQIRRSAPDLHDFPKREETQGSALYTGSLTASNRDMSHNRTWELKSNDVQVVQKPNSEIDNAPGMVSRVQNQDTLTAGEAIVVEMVSTTRTANVHSPRNCVADAGFTSYTGSMMTAHTVDKEEDDPYN